MYSNGLSREAAARANSGCWLVLTQHSPRAPVEGGRVSSGADTLVPDFAQPDDANGLNNLHDRLQI